MDEIEGQKEEVLKLIMEKNSQIKDMEAELEKLIKEKKKNVPMEVIPPNLVPLTGINTTKTTTTT
jgi:hypothetical protein